jgi:DNA-binding transcriptional regulator GbsR (MarR family)
MTAFQGAVAEKLLIVDAEVGILAQMEEIKSKVTEQAILSELTKAMAEKNRLVGVERQIIEDIQSVTAELDEVTKSTKESLDIQERVLAQLTETSSLQDLEEAETQLLADIKVLHSFDSLCLHEVRTLHFIINRG